MRLLLDTHVWIWLADSPHRLGRRTARRLSSPASEIFLSAVSVWEFVVLAQKGRFSRVRDPLPWIERALTGWPLQEVGLTWEVAKEAGLIALPQGDPVDRLLVATARVLGCTLVTEDEKIIESRLVPTLPND